MIGVLDIDHGPPDGFRIHLHWVSRKFPSSGEQLAGYYRVWYGQNGEGVGHLGNVRLSMGRAPDAYPASHAHVWVGQSLAWFTKHGPVAGYSPHYFGFYVGEAWTMRGGFVTDDHHDSVTALADEVIHEIGHLLVGEEWHAIEKTPRRLAALQAGAARAAAWANRLNLTGAA